MKISIEEAVALLQAGEVVAIPTETVYGLAACFENAAAVEKIYEIKNRPEQKPLSLLFSHFDQVKPLVLKWPDVMQKFQKFMPGSLTVVLPAISAEEMEMIFGKNFPVVDGGECVGKEASTVIKVLEKSFQVLRQGALAEEVLREVLELA